MNILAIETSTEYCSVALWQDGALTQRCELVGQKHSEVLMEMLDGVLQATGYKLQAMDGIAFGKGPGSFTGVRIACGVAQGLALGANLPVVGVCTLEALAEAGGRDKVIAALDARMGEIYHAAYEKEGDGWRAVVEPCLCKPGDAPMVAGAGWFAAGSGFAVDGGALLARYAGQLLNDGSIETTSPFEKGGSRGISVSMPLDATENPPPPPFSPARGTLVGAPLLRSDSSAVKRGQYFAVPQAAAIAALGAVRFARGEGVDAAQALPLYLRDKVALTTAERAR